SLAMNAQTGQPGQTGQSGTSPNRGTSAQPDKARQSGDAGQMNKKSGDQGANRMGSADNAWVMKVAQGSMLEVELGKLASTQASSDAVKQFGQRMVTDHSRANDELSEIATRKGITLPTSLDAKHQAMKDKFSKMNGAAFDKAYMEDMVKDHRTDVAEFRKESTSGRDADIKAFAAKTLPNLEEHLSMAEQTASSAKSGSKQ
ncbi:MAG: DUF4142 domain-containing protein, partial [Candidatus Solibacter sp.]